MKLGLSRLAPNLSLVVLVAAVSGCRHTVDIANLETPPENSEAAEIVFEDTVDSNIVEPPDSIEAELESEPVSKPKGRKFFTKRETSSLVLEARQSSIAHGQRILAERSEQPAQPPSPTPEIVPLPVAPAQSEAAVLNSRSTGELNPSTERPVGSETPGLAVKGPEPKKRGLGSWFKGRKKPTPQPEVQAVPTPEPKKSGRGLLSILSGNKKSVPATPVPTKVVEPPKATPVTAPEPATKAKKPGLFERFRRSKPDKPATDNLQTDGTLYL